MEWSSIAGVPAAIANRLGFEREPVPHGSWVTWAWELDGRLIARPARTQERALQSLVDDHGRGILEGLAYVGQFRDLDAALAAFQREWC